MKICPACQKENYDTAVKCQYCGASLRGAARTPGLGESPAAAPEGTSGKAIWSLICGVFFLFFPAAALAVVLGHIARSEIRRSGGRLSGGGMAATGLALGYVGLSLIPILMIAAIAIPGLLRAKMAANEASAVTSLRLIYTACDSYHGAYGVGYPKSLANLGPSASASAEAANIIDANLASGQKSGYLFSYRTGGRVDAASPMRYVVNADPITPGTTGTRHFFTDQTGIIRWGANHPASGESPPLR